MAHPNSTLFRVMRTSATVAVLASALALAGCSAVVGSTSPDAPAADQGPAVEPPAEEPADEPAEDEPAEEPADEPAEDEPAEETAPSGDSVGTDAIIGVWSPSDGSGIKVIDGSGACSGMYYNNGNPLDIGGPMSCALGSQQNSDGSYLLVVTQAPNQASYPVLFDGDSFTLYSGDQAITMTRQ